MPRGIKILLLIAVALVVAVTLVIIIFRGGIRTEAPPEPVNMPEEAAIPAAPGLPVPEGATGTIVTSVQVREITPEELEEQLARRSLETLAFGFAERYGSFSNESDYSNFSDLFDFMTSGMQSRSQTLVSRLRAESEGQNVYKGVTTRALSSDFRSYSEASGRAQVVVDTQRQETVGSPNNTRIYYQDLLLSFRKEGGIWLVDNAIWQDERR